MRRSLLAVASLFAGVAVAAPWQRAQSQEPEAEKPVVLKVGDEAPDFELPMQAGTQDKWKLSDHRGENVIISFVPAAFSPACAMQARSSWVRGRLRLPATIAAAPTTCCRPPARPAPTAACRSITSCAA